MLTPRLLLASAALLASAMAEDRVAGLPKIVRTLPVPESARNPWPAELEDAYWKRINACFAHWNYNGKYGGTFFESELRECVVYLMAEETGNLDTAKIYKDRIRAYVTALFNTGMGEWDSANYLHHGLTAWFQLYDFAKDPEVRMLGKAALDWIHAAAAVKYFRGNWAGPNKRDYNNLPQFEGAPGFFWLTFGDTPSPPEDPEFDLIHQITSPYRPPEAVVALAGKDFAKPVEILASKPSYDGWFRKPGGEDAPAFFETNYISDGFQVGTLPEGHSGDVCGFRMASVNAKTGSDIWVLSTALKGYVDGIATGTIGGDRIAQFRNLVIYANPRGDVPFYFLVPDGVKVAERDGIHFLGTESVWIAVTPVNAKVKGLDAEATASIRGGKRPLAGCQIWSAMGAGQGPTALILEIGDRTMHGDFAAFQKAVLAKSKADLSAVDRGEIHYVGSGGGRVGLRLGGEKPTVFRDGKEYDWKSHMALYATADGSSSQPVSLGRKGGVLKVQAAGHTFTGTFRDGRYAFTNE